ADGASPVLSSSEDNAEDNDGMSYCIDWARSDGIVIDSPAAPRLPGLAMSAGAGRGQEGVCLDALLSKYRRQLKQASSSYADRVDVVRKTMLPMEAPAKMCLRCGHITRRSALQDSDGGSAGEPGRGDIGWVHRFDILCVCGGSWIVV
ncbi:hypothetical protein EV175_006723, partial [Coemansia sp. RSA 1933]